MSHSEGAAPQDLLAAAAAMRPVLRERQQQCEQEGRLPEATHQDFLAAGFYRALQPRRFGGYEFSITDYARLLIEVSRGCSDSGWVLSLIASQPRGFLCLFPEEVQRDVYGEGDCRMPVVVAPGGTAFAAEGGFRVKGAWDYASGCDVATHFLGALVLIDPATQAPTGLGYFLFDRADFTIVDNWNVTGMQGTGSRRVVVEERRMPAHRTIPVSEQQMQQAAPGTGAPLAIYQFALHAVAIGTARGAFDHYEKILREKRWIVPPFPPRFEMPELQHAFGEAQSLIDTAEAALLAFTSQYTEGVSRGMNAEATRRLGRAAGQCLDLSWRATDLMFRTGGSSSASRTSLLGRCYRNLAVMRTHVGVQVDHTSINVARMHFGLPPTSLV